MWNRSSLLAKSLLVIFALLVCIPLLANLKSAYYFCLHAIDFSIYQQAIYEMADGVSWNPYVSVRDLNIFNDHADPAVFFGAIFLKFTPISRYSLLFFEWLWFVANIFIVYFFGEFKNKRVEETLVAIALIVFSRPLLMGIEFPIHPTTWSMLPAVLVSYFIIRNNVKYLLITLIFLCLFREIYGFMVIGLSGYYFINRRIVDGLKIFILGIFFVLLLIVFRPLLVGPVVDYGNGVMRDFFTGGLSYFVTKIKSFELPWNTYLQYLFSIFVLIFFEFKRKRLTLKHPVVAIIFFITPALVIHIVVGRIAHHQAIPMVAPIIGLLVFSNFIPHLLEEKRAIMWGIILLMISTASSRYSRGFSFLFDFSGEKGCKTTALKREKGEEVLNIVKSLDKNKVILATGGIIPAILSPRMSIFQISGDHRIQPRYDYIVYERPKIGNPYPLKDEELVQILERCSKFMTRSLLDNGYYVVWEGNFSDQCTMQSTYWPNTPESLIPKSH